MATKEIESLIKDFFLDKQEIAAVYLFGSHATGKNAHMSDVDIGLLFHHSFLASVETLKDAYIVQLGRVLRKDVHPVVMNNAGEVVLKQILSKGRVILENDPIFARRFRMAAVARIADFGYLLKTMQAGFKRKVLEG
ncbi:MAG: nucleotidyltransferase domain-containing protein [Thermodesulfobacteriota bacterium]|nr:nucleotidyltransferase domain-containing protein [Thermodesulfobacteriota bacterium]